MCVESLVPGSTAFNQVVTAVRKENSSTVPRGRSCGAPARVERGHSLPQMFAWSLDFKAKTLLSAQLVLTLEQCRT